MRILRTFILTLAFLATAVGAKAQCTFRNTAFQGGEYLTYNLYFNWKFVWVKAGTASMSVVKTVRSGKPAYRASLTTRGNARADKLFYMRDTLLSYVTTDLAPLYYRKGSVEGERYRVDEVFYSYPSGKPHVKQHRIDADGNHHWQQHTYDDCVYDMLSIFLRARSFDPANWRKGHVISFPIVDGNSRDPAQLTYAGHEKVKGDDGHTYHCLALSYKQQHKGKWCEIARFYVTDDHNHVPVRLDLFLRIGSAKAFLVNMKGNRSPITAKNK